MKTFKMIVLVGVTCALMACSLTYSQIHSQATAKSTQGCDDVVTLRKEAIDAATVCHPEAQKADEAEAN